MGELVEIVPDTFSSAGDSGSAILANSTKAPVGLLFAGSSTSTIANDIANVHQKPGVTVGTTTRAASAEGLIAPLNPEQARLEAIQERIPALPSVVGMGIGSDGGG